MGIVNPLPGRPKKMMLKPAVKEQPWKITKTPLAHELGVRPARGITHEFNRPEGRPGLPDAEGRKVEKKYTPAELESRRVAELNAYKSRLNKLGQEAIVLRNRLEDNKGKVPQQEVAKLSAQLRANRMQADQIIQIQGERIEELESMRRGGRRRREPGRLERGEERGGRGWREPERIRGGYEDPWARERRVSQNFMQQGQMQGGVSEERLAELIEAARREGAEESAKKIAEAAKSDGSEGAIRAIHEGPYDEKTKAKLVAKLLGSDLKDAEKKSALGGFAEGGANFGKGLMGLMNPGIFGSLLFIVVIILLIWIVLQLFPLVGKWI